MVEAVVVYWCLFVCLFVKFEFQFLCHQRQDLEFLHFYTFVCKTGIIIPLE